MVGEDMDRLSVPNQKNCFKIREFSKGFVTTTTTRDVERKTRRKGHFEYIYNQKKNYQVVRNCKHACHIFSENRWQF